MNMSSQRYMGRHKCLENLNSVIPSEVLCKCTDGEGLSQGSGTVREIFPKPKSDHAISLLQTLQGLPMSPYGLQGKVQAVRLATKSSTVWTRSPARPISCCSLSHSLYSGHFKNWSTLQQTKFVNVLKALPMLLCLLAHTHTHTLLHLMNPYPSFKGQL